MRKKKDNISSLEFENNIDKDNKINKFEKSDIDIKKKNAIKPLPILKKRIKKGKHSATKRLSQITREFKIADIGGDDDENESSVRSSWLCFSVVLSLFVTQITRVS
jgi:hypothetical protein